MAISIDWSTKIISIPQAYLSSIGGGVYSLDTNQFRLDLKDLEDDVTGIPMLDTHRHNAPVTLGGATYARTLEIINGYTITFENGTYAIELINSNNNISSVTNVNSVSIRSNNSAGLVYGSGGASAADVWSYSISGKIAANRLKDADDNAEIASIS